MTAWNIFRFEIFGPDSIDFSPMSNPTKDPSAPNYTPPDNRDATPRTSPEVPLSRSSVDVSRFPAEVSLPRKRRDYLLAAMIIAAMTLSLFGVYGLWNNYFGKVEPPNVDLTGLDTEIVDAITTARKAVQLQPRSAEAWGKLGAVLRAHRLAFTNACFVEAHRLDPKDYRWPYLVGINLISADQEAGLSFLRLAVEVCGDEPVPRLRLGEALLERGELTEAETHFLRSLKKGPLNDARAHLGLGRIAMESDDREGALEHLRKAVELAPGAKVAHVSLAKAYHLYGDEEASKKAQRNAALLSDELVWPDPCEEYVDRSWVGLRARMSRINLMDTHGLREEAIVAARQAMYLYPESALTRLVLGQMQNRSKNFSAAEPILREAIRMDSKSAKAHFELGYALHAQGKVTEATECYRQSIEYRADFATAHFNLALGLQALKDDAGAMTELEAAIRFRPEYADAHIALAVMLERLDRHADALLHAEEAVRLAPSDDRCKQLLSQLQAKDATP